jgi:integrase
VKAKPRTAVERDENTKLYALADLRLSERKIELAQNKGDIGSWSTESVSDICRKTGQRKKTKKTQDAWAMLAVHLGKVGIGQKQISSLTVQDCQQFRAWLTNGNFSQSTQSKYFGLFRSMLKDANMAGHTSIGLHDRVNAIARGKASKEYLTQEELSRLFATPVRSSRTRKVFLFSCLTGMRYSDIRGLKWENVHDLDGGLCQLRYKMKKTGLGHVLLISEEAREILGKRDKAAKTVFPDIPSSQSVNYTIDLWHKRAGIAKQISFHSGRHTFATLSLSNGVPIKVVSDWLGHSSVVQTEVYARLLADERDRYVGAVSLVKPVR